MRLNELNSHNSPPTGVKGSAEQYLNRVYLLFLDLLEQNKVNDVHEQVKVTVTFRDGSTEEDTLEAGSYLVEKIFETHEYEDIKKRFLDSCSCPNKDEMINYLQYLVKEYGGDTIEKDDWLDLAEEFEDCLEFLGDDDN